MKRDLDLVRKILFKMEEMDQWIIADAHSIPIEGYSENQVQYHLGLMVQANLLHAETRSVNITSKYSLTADSTGIKFQDYSISWFGHEFLTATRDEVRWKKTKEAIVKVGGLATDVAFDILKEMGKQAAVKLLLP